jgi:type I restriction enzyme, S subunit
MPRDSTPFRDSGAIELFLATANITSVVGGTAQPQLTLDGLSNVIALNYPKKIGAKFDAIIAPLSALCDSLAMANANLRQTRDLLLPRLISGEIDVATLEMPG